MAKTIIKRLMGISFLALFAGIVLFLEPVQAAKQMHVLTGVTTGKRRVINQNIQQAKQKAVSDALELALQNAFSSIVSRQVFATNLDFFYDQILSRTSDYILAYRVLGGIENKGYFLVGVETKVNVSLLEKKLTDAKILNASNDKPTILFFIAEKTPDDLLPKYWWGNNPIPYQSTAEEIIVKKMIQNRFFVIGIGPERPDPSFYNVSFRTIYDVGAAKKLGVGMKADMVVFGKASSLESINRMGEEKIFNAIINLDVYNLETGEKVLTSQIDAAAKSDISSQGQIDAIVNAANLAAIDLSKKIDAYWAEQLRREHAFDVRIEGLDFLPRFIALKQRFKQMPGIENMQPREMGSNYALLQVFYKGKPSQFADTVMLKTFESFGIEVLDVSDSLVTIRFIEKEQESLLNESEEAPALDQALEKTTE
ncbi:MAG: hypothetical protein L3J69_04060 [Desulfobacula sp.]|nr:hypothetical protein [Desulfobacula sp.]